MRKLKVYLTVEVSYRGRIDHDEDIIIQEAARRNRMQPLGSGASCFGVRYRDFSFHGTAEHTRAFLADLGV